MKHPVIITSGGKIERRDNYDRNSIFSKFLSSAPGRQLLASKMIAPLRTTLDYQGLSRKVFQVQSLPDGALPVYDSDLKVEECITSPLGKYKYDTIKINSRGNVYRKGSLSGAIRRITFPQFELYSNPTIKISDVKHRRFDIIDRAVNKLKQSMMAEEDSRIFDMLDKLSSKK